MPNIKTILLPVDIPNASLAVIHQAAALARHFHSEIIMLHVVTSENYIPGMKSEATRVTGDILAEIIQEAHKKHDNSLATELEGLSIRSILAEGDAAKIIGSTAQQEHADLIMIASHGFAFNRFLLGSVTAKVLNENECPVWTGAHAEESQTQKFAIRNILCAVGLRPHSRKTVSWAADLAAKFDARLTLAHVTAGVEIWGPGGNYIKMDWKDALVSDASKHVEELQRDVGTKAEVFIGSGNVPTVLSQVAKHTKADLLVTGSRPYEGQLRTHGYAIICAVPIPVLSV